MQEARHEVLLRWDVHKAGEKKCKWFCEVCSAFVNMGNLMIQQIADLCEFILKYSFSEKLIPGDDYVYVCKFCGKEGYEKSSTQHKILCEVGRLLNKASKTQRNHLAQSEEGENVMIGYCIKSIVKWLRVREKGCFNCLHVTRCNSRLVCDLCRESKKRMYWHLYSDEM